MNIIGRNDPDPTPEVILKLLDIGVEGLMEGKKKAIKLGIREMVKFARQHMFAPGPVPLPALASAIEGDVRQLYASYAPLHQQTDATVARVNQVNTRIASARLPDRNQERFV